MICLAVVPAALRRERCHGRARIERKLHDVDFSIAGAGVVT